MLKEKIRQALEHVKDPEMPAASIVELGMFEDVGINDNTIVVKLLPTFSGCPALPLIEKEVKNAVEQLNPGFPVQVVFLKTPPWTTERIAPEAREKLKQFGIAPPPLRHKQGDPWEIDCPYCGSTYVTMENIFGPSACRSILYCKNCKNPFEAMKPVATL